MDFKKILNSKILLSLFILIIILLTPSFFRYYKEKGFLEKKINNLNKNIEEIDEENKELEKEIIALQGEEGSDRILRKMYILKKQGEKALVMPKELLKIEDEEEKEKKGLFERIKDIFLRD